VEQYGARLLCQLMYPSDQKGILDQVGVLASETIRSVVSLALHNGFIVFIQFGTGLGTLGWP
jgi:hypothetical protein